MIHLARITGQYPPRRSRRAARGRRDGRPRTAVDRGGIRLERLELRRLMAADLTGQAALPHDLVRDTIDAPAAAAATGQPFVGSIRPFESTFELASLPSANRTIYLDFTGFVIPVGSPWNAGTTERPLAAFTADSSPLFNTDELQIIQHTWARVAELYSPFNVNVTTKEPAVSDLVWSGPSDQRWGMRCVISAATNNPAAGAGGVAFLSTFRSDSDVACFVNTSGTGPSADNISLAVAHEVGHTIGLTHHGVRAPTAAEYFGGHGPADFSWGPVMGAPYDRRVKQWSRGEYANASNAGQDDLAVITNPASPHSLPYRADDRSDAFARATPLTSVVGSIMLAGGGIIERNTDADMFVFTVSAGAVDLQVRPFDQIDQQRFAGASLDVGATLYSLDGKVVADMRPANRLDAQFTGTLAAGIYYVRVFGTGNANRLTDGYSNYGSLGQYTVSVRNSPQAALPIASVVGPSQSVGEGGAATFTIVLSAAATAPVEIGYTTVSGKATAGRDFTHAAGVVTFAAGETVKTVTVSITDDTMSEADENFTLQLVRRPGPYVLGTKTAAATIASSDDGPARAYGSWVALATARQKPTAAAGSGSGLSAAASTAAAYRRYQSAASPSSATPSRATTAAFRSYQPLFPLAS